MGDRLRGFIGAGLEGSFRYGTAHFLQIISCKSGSGV